MLEELRDWSALVGNSRVWVHGKSGTWVDGFGLIAFVGVFRVCGWFDWGY